MTEILHFFSLLSEVQLIVGLAISTSAIAILRDWRWNLFFLLVQYILAGLLISSSVLLSIALIKILMGAITTLILYWTARSVAVSRAGRGEEKSPVLADGMGLPLRFLSVLLGALVITTLQVRYPVPAVDSFINAGTYWLLGTGLVIIMLTKEPFRMGLGILLFQSGFELLYVVLEPSLVVIGLTGGITLLTALLISYLTTANMVPWSDERVPEPHSMRAVDEAIRTLLASVRPEAEAPSQEGEG
ncbi:MAG: hypothetical protein GXP41_07910 [Chloroflexi bacterium]|nr:hypothetical protein [Chloroflexota bacterium]